VLKDFSNRIVKILVEQSWLTEVELDVLLCRRYAKRTGLKVKNVIKMRDKPTTFGSFSRSSKQASVAVKRTILTLALLVLLDLVEEDTLNKLQDLVSLLKSASESRSDAVEDLIRDYVNQLM